MEDHHFSLLDIHIIFRSLSWSEFCSISSIFTYLAWNSLLLSYGFIIVICWNNNICLRSAVYYTCWLIAAYRDGVQPPGLENNPRRKRKACLVVINSAVEPLLSYEAYLYLYLVTQITLFSSPRFLLFRFFIQTWLDENSLFTFLLYLYLYGTDIVGYQPSDPFSFSSTFE